jgi:GNAT superfamily N-acetyltransferase
LPNCTIRDARIDDVADMFAMLRASAEEQGGLDQFCVDEDSLRADGFGPAPRFAALLAEIEGRPAGLALYFLTYSTWTSRNGLYLEDLYVRPEFRRYGVARALMQRLAQVAVDHSAGRFVWLVLRDNIPAIRFYESLKASGMPDWLLMRMKSDALRELAAGSQRGQNRD